MEKKDHIEKRITLDSLKKKNIYSVSDDYFRKLPTQIQERVVESDKTGSRQHVISLSLRFALPLLALVLMVTYFGMRINNDDINVQALLDDIPTEELITYISESDLSTDQLLSMIDMDELDVDGLVEENVLFDDDELDLIMDEFPGIENDI